MANQEEDFTTDAVGSLQPAVQVSKPLDAATVFDLTENRESTRGDLARGLLWLLTFAIGGVLAFIGLGLLEGSVLTESIFPSLVALSGTALGFYFGSQTAQSSVGKLGDSLAPVPLAPVALTAAPAAQAPAAQAPAAQAPAAQAPAAQAPAAQAPPAQAPPAQAP